MNSKTSYTLSISPSSRTYEKSNAIFESNIAKSLYLAQQKIRPVINDILKTATENSIAKSVNRSHYLTLEQYEDVISASQILKEVDKILSENQSGTDAKKTYNLNNFNLERESVKVNKFGKIYVDTSILIQLIELHKSLGDIINNAQEILTDVSSCTNYADLSKNVEHYEGKDTSDEKFSVTIVHKNLKENTKPKIKISVLNKKNGSKQRSKETELERKIIQNICSQRCSLHKNTMVMTANTAKLQEPNKTKKLSTLSEERMSSSEANLIQSRPSSRRIKSTGSIKSDSHGSKITNVAGARKIILNCLYDLKKVRSFLGRIDMEVSTDVQIQSALFEKNSVEHIQQPTEAQEDHAYTQNTGAVRKRSQNNLQAINNNNENKDDHTGHLPKIIFSQSDVTNTKEGCSCGPTYVSETPMELLLEAGGENASKLIICIKGKTEEEGDVQIIIRQCSECKNVGGNDLADAQNDIFGKDPSEHNIFTSDSAVSDGEKRISEGEDVRDGDASDQRSQTNLSADPNRASRLIVASSKNLLNPNESRTSLTRRVTALSGEMEEDGRIHVLFDPDHPSQTVIETLKSEGKDDMPQDKDDSVIALSPSREPVQEKSGINIIFDPREPSKSRVESQKNVVSNKDLLHVNEACAKEIERNDDCSRIKLYETTNLCFSTDDGQELIISLTVRPKSGEPPPKLSLNDIFSESPSRTDKTYNEQTQQHVDQIFTSDREVTVGIQDKQEYDYFIPLSRTKVCSSLEFDVSVMDTTLQNKGIKHVNQGIVVRLKDMGVNKLLRACRPVKCGRPSVLNEKLRKDLPYSASLTSLPLEETDADIIDQSFKMSFNRTKYSSAKRKKKMMAYFTQLGNITDDINFTKDVQINFVYIQESRSGNLLWSKNNWERKKLSYYINLIHDVQTEYKECIYEVNFFEIKKYNGDQQKSAINTLLRNKVNVLHEDCSEIGKEHELMSSIYTGITKENLALKSGSMLELHQGKNVSTLHKYKHVVSNTSQFRHEISAEQNTKRTFNEERKKLVSKIPVYKFNRRRKNHNKDNLTCKSYIYDISLQSLPRDHGNELKDFKIFQNGDNKIKNSLKEIVLKDPTEIHNKDYNNDMKTNHNSKNKIINNHEIDLFKRTSNDSLELYFNNFFRDKYFSKLALSEKKSSSRSLKPRKKKSEYHSSRSHSQTCISDSKLSLRCASRNFKDRRQDSEQTNTSENGSLSENDFSERENLKFSLSLICHFTKMFCEYWVTHKFMKENEDVKRSLTSVKNISSEDRPEDEVIKKLCRNIKQKILQENTCNISTFLSQPNVEAGMDNEDSSIHFIRRMSELNDTFLSKQSLLPVRNKYNGMFKKNKSISNFIKVHNDTKNNSCDNFQNVILSFESSTSINAFPTPTSMSHQKGFLESLKYSSANDEWARISENLGHNVGKIRETDNWEQGEIDPLCYLVYQHYFNTPSLLQRVIEKSRKLFKSSCNSNNTNSLKDNPYDTMDCMCAREQPKSICTDKISSYKPDPPDKHIKGLDNPVCKICGCSIKDCQSGKGCACPNETKPRKMKLKNMSSKQPKLRKTVPKRLILCPNKKSVGVVCVPEKVDMAVCVERVSEVQWKSPKKCYCIKCEKRSVDGSCYCSHCLGIFDKSVAIKPSNKEIATQCACYKSKNICKDATNKSIYYENEQNKQMLYTNIEYSQFETISPITSDSEDKKDITNFTFKEDKKPIIIKKECESEESIDSQKLN